MAENTPRASQGSSLCGYHENWVSWHAEATPACLQSAVQVVLVKHMASWCELVLIFSLNALHRCPLGLVNICLQLILISRAKVKDFSSWKMRCLVCSKQQIVRTGLLSFKCYWQIFQQAKRQSRVVRRCLHAAPEGQKSLDNMDPAGE